MTARHHHHRGTCGVCAAKGAAALPVQATKGLGLLAAAPYVGAWKLGKAIFGRGAWRLSPEAQARRDARRARRAGRHAGVAGVTHVAREVARREEPQAKWSDRR